MSNLFYGVVIITADPRVAAFVPSEVWSLTSYTALPFVHPAVVFRFTEVNDVGVADDADKANIPGPPRSTYAPDVLTSVPPPLTVGATVYSAR